MRTAASLTDPSFQEQFLSSLQCCLMAFYPQQNFFQNLNRSSQALPLLYQPSSCNILFFFFLVANSTFFTASSQGVDSISRNHFLCSSIRSNASSIKVLSWDFYWVFLVAQLVKNPPAVQETQAQSLHGEDPLEKEMATHSSILVWKIPWTEEPGRLQSMGSQRVGHDLATKPPPWDSSNLVSSLGSILNSSSLAISTISVATSSTEVLKPSKSSRRAGVNFFQTHVHVDILTASYESLMSFMAWWILSRRFSTEFAMILRGNHYF